MNEKRHSWRLCLPSRHFSKPALGFLLTIGLIAVLISSCNAGIAAKPNPPASAAGSTPTFGASLEPALDTATSTPAGNPTPPPLPDAPASWNRTYGSGGTDYGYGAIECRLGGFAFTGFLGGQMVLVRYDDDGNELWSRSYGDTCGRSVLELSDGGFVIAGYTSGPGAYDCRLVRTDSGGNQLWSRTYGGSGQDVGQNLVECSDGGFALSGWTTSFGAGGFDLYLVRTDSSGNLLWYRTFGGSGEEEGRQLVQVSDGGFVIASYTTSFGAGQYDLWLVRTDSSGNQLWNRTYGGIQSDLARGLVQLSDGGFAVVGFTDSSGAGTWDTWLLRTDTSGICLWNRTYGGPNWEGWPSVTKVRDGGLAIAGYTMSRGAGAEDFWLIRTDDAGNPQWNVTYGGAGHDISCTIVECSTGGFALAGWTDSFGAGGYDFWLVRTSPAIWWIEKPTDQLLNSGTTFRYDLNASARAGLDLWWTNDTFNFAINAQGILSNATSLLFGTYGVQVTVNDTLGYVLTASFTVTVLIPGAPIWIQTPANQVVEYGCSFRYDLNATDPDGLDCWWLNDTVWFQIDEWGIVRNNTALPVAVYGLQVWINDTKGYVQTATFKAAVQDTTPPTWNETPSSHIVEFEVEFRCDVNASDLSGIDHYWINASAFAVDNAGVIANATHLAVGIYWIEARAYDPYTNYCTATFSVEVQDTYAPTWVQLPTYRVVEYGNSFRYDLNATDLSGINYWWLNDTVHFTVDANGVITAGALPVGIYGLQVRAYDPYSRYCAANFTVTVHDTLAPTWAITPTDQLLAYGETLDYQLAAWDLSAIDHWTVNDTVHFAIGSTGHLTSVEALAPGRYSITITVYDPYGNARDAIIVITVQAETTTTTPPPGIPGFPWASVLLACIAAVSLSVLRRRRRA